MWDRGTNRIKNPNRRVIFGRRRKSYFILKVRKGEQVGYFEGEKKGKFNGLHLHVDTRARHAEPPERERKEGHVQLQERR